MAASGALVRQYYRMLSYSVVRAQYLADTSLGGEGATPAIERALERIGWRAVREPTPAELAAHLLLLLDACVYEHRDVSVLTAGIASTLRDTGPLLDGGLPPMEAYLPAAEELLQHYLDRRPAASTDFTW